MEYLTQWQGRVVKDSSGQTAGKIEDLIVVNEDPLPHVKAVHIKTKSGFIIAGLDALLIDGIKVSLRSTIEKSQEYEIKPLDFHLRKALLDKQILDMNGRRVVRVNDVALIRRHDKLFVVGVEAGFLSLLRRLNLDGLALKLPKRIRRKLMSQIISWNEVETFGGAVQLKIPHEKIAQLHPADIADIVEQLDPVRRAEVFDSLDIETAADTLEETEPEISKAIIESLDVEKAADIVEEMDPDEAADLLADLTEAHSKDLLQHMEAEEAADVQELLNYDEESAGGMMTTEFVALPRTLTVEETIVRLRELHPDAETIYYLYVLDEDEQLVGVLSLRDLIISSPETQIADIMVKKVISVVITSSTDEVVQTIAKYSLLALPVVDFENRLKGIITVDDTLYTLLPQPFKRRLPPQND